MFQLKYQDGTPVPPPHRYSIRHSPIDNGPRRWPYRHVEIFDGETRIGEYVRRYSAYVESTFYPFEQNGRWFALYSGDYTCTRVLSLPDCTDIGGEEPDSYGFCPVEFYVPAYIHENFYFPRDDDRPEKQRHSQAFYWDNGPRRNISEGSDHWKPGWFRTLSNWTYVPFGFVSGCIWGDDSSWKLQFLDLARASEGIIERKELFGYVQLAEGLTLRQSIDMVDWSPDNPCINYVSSRTMNLKTGEHESGRD